MKKAARCDTSIESLQREPGQVAPMQNPALMKFNTEESFLFLDTTFNIITFNRSLQKFWINFAKNIRKGDLFLTNVPTHRLAIPENILLKAMTAKEPGDEIALPSGEKGIPRSYKNYSSCLVTTPVDLNSFTEVVKSIESFWISIVRVPQKN